MAFRFGGHAPSLKGRHPGSSTGPLLKGMGQGANPLGYLPPGLTPPVGPSFSPPSLGTRQMTGGLPRPPVAPPLAPPRAPPGLPMKRGGRVPDTDTVRARLTPGEFVVKRSEAQKPENKAALERMNQGRGYAKGGTVTIGPEKKGQEPVTFKKGALHRQLGVPEGEKIPASKMASAKSGSLGPLAQKRANFAQGMLKAGRKTAAKGR